MKRIISAIVLSLSIFIFASQPASANSSYKNSKWASSLSNGTLKVQGPGYGNWGKSWVTIDSGVKQYWEVGTSKGPVIVYTKGSKNWKVVQLHFSTGAKQNLRSFNQPVRIVRGGAYGAIIKVGNICYDYSWSQLKQIPCR